MPVSLENPYLPGRTDWLRGNLHTHTDRSDGNRDPQAVIDDYAERGYEFLSVTDHDVLFDPSGFETRGMILIPGNEVSREGPHICHIGASSLVQHDPDRQKVLEGIAADGGFAIMNHPNWLEHYDHCPLGLLEELQGYAGIEIYNGVIWWHTGSPFATDKWDRLLGQGLRTWGFANDDSHVEDHFAVGWNMVQTEERTADSVMDSLLNGRFYASSGVTITSIEVEGASLRVTTVREGRLNVLSDYGHRRAHADGREIAFTVPEDADYTYVRVECWGSGEAMAWTQPFFIRK